MTKPKRSQLLKQLQLKRQRNRFDGVLRADIPIEDLSITNDSAFELPELDIAGFSEAFRRILADPNLGAGIDVSGVSGSGKSNFSEWAAIESLRMGIPFIHLDPHGTSAIKVAKMVQTLPTRLKSKVIYLDFSDPKSIASINPLQHPANEDKLSNYERESFEKIRIELAASMVLAAVGEAGASFGHRPVLRKWVTRWLRLLYQANLTLPDAQMLIDPKHPVYEHLLKLAPDDLAYYQMDALSNMRPTDLENEIGSARNRMMTLLEHPATRAVLGRRQCCVDFDAIYQNDISLIFNLHTGQILTDEVQSLFANVVLTQYLQVVFATPEHLRRRRLCMIDELPVFIDTCGPLLERMVTEIRKFQSSFMFLHQGASRFEGRTENPFLLSILDMCRAKLFFRHRVDADFFAKQVTRACKQKPRVKHIQVSEQQFQDGHEILTLVDRSDGSTTTSGDTTGAGSSTSLTSTLANAVTDADHKTETTSTANGSVTQLSNSQHQSNSRTSSVTHKQTAIAKMVTRRLVTSKSFFSVEEIDRDAAGMMAGLDTGQGILIVDGWESPFLVMTPEAKDPYSHAPKFGHKKLNQWLAKIRATDEFVSPEEILVELQEFQTVLLSQLQSMPPRIAGTQLYLPRSNDSTSDQSDQFLLPSEDETPDELGL